MTSRKIVAVFDSQAAAQGARDSLLQLGLQRDQISITDQSSSEHTLHTSEGHGSFWAHVKEMFMPEADRHTIEESVRRGGFVLVATVGEARADEAVARLDQAGAVDLDERENQWRSAGWPGGSRVGADAATDTAAGDAAADSRFESGAGRARATGANVVPTNAPVETARARSVAGENAPGGRDRNAAARADSELAARDVGQRSAPGAIDRDGAARTESQLAARDVAPRTAPGTVDRGTKTRPTPGIEAREAAARAEPRQGDRDIEGGRTEQGVINRDAEARREERVADRDVAARAGSRLDNDDAGGTFPVVEERLRIGKREVNRGSVRVRSYIVEEPVHEEVRLREEHVAVERRPVDAPARSASKGSSDDLFRERTIEMTETSEQAVVGKETRVTEEVRVSKTANERVERIDDTVRHTKVDVDDSRNAETGRPRSAGLNTPLPKRS
jgi:uncharacterized protein (TIGR02271 family)